MKNITLKKSNIGQFEKGVFAMRNFKKDEIVIRYNLKKITPYLS